MLQLFDKLSSRLRKGNKSEIFFLRMEGKYIVDFDLI